MKKVGSCLYVHKSNRQELFADKHISENDYEHIRTIVLGMDGFYDYEVIKYDYKSRRLSLIKSPDWNTSNEPIVGNSLVYDISVGKDLSDTPKKSVNASKNNPQIYHSKELFVSDKYDGFDIDKARKRTEEWSRIPNLDKKKIGRLNYWIWLLKLNEMEV